MRRTHYTILLLLLFTLVIIPGCSIQKLAIRSTGSVLDASFEALMAEDDLELAKTAIESDLKILEGFLNIDSSNKELLLLAAQGFASYALGFVEDEDPARAVKLYERSRRYASRWLIAEADIDLYAITNLTEFEAAVAELDDEDVPGVFWMANSWASILNLSLENVEAISQFPKVETMMDYVVKNNEEYYYGGVHLFFGSYFGARPKMLGGDLDRAKKHFARQRELVEFPFLLCDLFEVRFVHLQELDEEASRAKLNYILNFDLDKAPEIRLINKIAQKKAAHLLDNLDDYL
ncbi:TRAP transporter TatT component family protein [bacterium]|nr:TRAP transporter TatT component family protein [bacterium]